MGGPDNMGNMIGACDTGHYNIHGALSALVFGKPMPKNTTRSERFAALRGYNKWLIAGKPGNPHAAYAMTHWAGLPQTERVWLLMYVGGGVILLLIVVLLVLFLTGVIWHGEDSVRRCP
jgi:hypothetical protein